jgi:hypothetical protein
VCSLAFKEHQVGAAATIKISNCHITPYCGICSFHVFEFYFSHSVKSGISLGCNIGFSES